MQSTIASVWSVTEMTRLRVLRNFFARRKNGIRVRTSAGIRKSRSHGRANSILKFDIGNYLSNIFARMQPPFRKKQKQCKRRDP